MSITGIDHVLVAVTDLEAAAIAYHRLGFETSPRGRHLGWGTANYCLMFPDDYIELIGIVDRHERVQGLDRFLENGEGLYGVAFATPNAAEAAEALRRRGIAVEDPVELARQLELPEGTALPRFSLVHLPAAATPALSSFVCGHQTPTLLRRQPWLEHPNGAQKIERVVVAVEDTKPLIEAYERTFGYGQVNTTDDVLTVHLGRHRLVFANPDDLEAMYPELKIEVGIGPRAAVLTLGVRNRDQTAEYLATAQVAFIDTPGGPVVEADDACGIALEFV